MSTSALQTATSSGSSSNSHMSKRRQIQYTTIQTPKRPILIPSSFPDLLSFVKFAHKASPDVFDELVMMPDFDHLICQHFDIQPREEEEDKGKKKVAAMNYVARRFGVNVIVRHYVEKGHISVEGYDYLLKRESDSEVGEEEGSDGEMGVKVLEVDR